MEVQWRSTHRKILSIPTDPSLWTSLSSVDLLGQQVRAAPFDTLLLFLCAHGARHQWDRLKYDGGTRSTLPARMSRESVGVLAIHLPKDWTCLVVLRDLGRRQGPVIEGHHERIPLERTIQCSLVADEERKTCVPAA